MLLGEKYRIERVVAFGGMSTVYQAKDVTLGRRVALKVLPEGLEIDSPFAIRFQREVQVAGSIVHPNVVTILDAGRDKRGYRFMAMELLDGESLASRITETPLPPLRFAARVARHTLEGLAAAHALEVIHRDIKPENIVLIGAHERPGVKLIDFGVSKVDDEWGKLTSLGDVIGTPYYLSPEAARGAKVDHRTDIWAVGVLLYEMITGELPFRGPTLLSTIAAIIDRTPDTPSRVRPDIPAELDAVVLRALARNPDQRFQTATDMREALDEIGTSLSGAQRQSLWRMRPVKRARQAS